MDRVSISKYAVYSWFNQKKHPADCAWRGAHYGWLLSLVAVMVWSVAAHAEVERPAVLNTVEVSDALVQQMQLQNSTQGDHASSTTDQANQKKKLIERIALQKAIVRLAGTNAVLKNEIINSVLDAPAKAIRSVQARPSLGVTEVVVDEMFVKSALDRSGVAWWKIQRPKIWVRLVHVKGYERVWRGLDEPWAKQVVQELHDRGFTAIGPEPHRMGGERAASEFLGGFWETYIEEAENYDGYLFVRVAEQNGYATVKVTFNLRGQEAELTQQVSAQPGSYQTLLNTAFERVVQELLAVSQTVIEQGAQFTVKLIDAGDLATVFSVESILVKLTGPSSVHLTLLNPTQVEFSVKPALGWLRWIESVRKVPNLDIVSETHNQVVVRWLN